jgi:hypothetical protein
MDIRLNQPTTRYGQKAGPREIYGTGRGVEIEATQGDEVLQDGKNRTDHMQRVSDEVCG